MNAGFLADMDKNAEYPGVSLFVLYKAGIRRGSLRVNMALFTLM